MRTGWMLAALAAAFGLVVTPPAVASADKSATDTINDLQSQGYTVTIDRIGTGPLSQCVVTDVRNPQQTQQWMPLVGPVLGGGDRNVLIPVTTSKTISVSLDCSR